MKLRKNTNEAGFTLVELAIVMMIIGLLIGGILKGQELMANSRITRAVADLKSYQAGYTAFQDTYDALPGDMIKATDRLAGCDAGNFCVDGNGDGRIGDPADPFDINQAGIAALPQVEVAMFWKHLLLAELIAGVEPAADPAAPAFGSSHPINQVGGGFKVGFNSGAAGDPNIAKATHMIFTSFAINGGFNAQVGLTVHQAMVMDRKIDDGQPSSGDLYAERVGTGCKTGDNIDDTYRTDNLTQTNCMLFYFID